MPSKDFVTKLIVDSKSYQSGMDQASKALDKYQRQNLSTSAAIKTATSALSKYVSVAALAKGAQEFLNATIQGSQTTADAFAATMESAKTAVSTFFSSLSTGDFTQFNLGLESLINKSREAYAALDRLGNASMSWGYFQTSRMADLTDLQAVVNDKSLPLSERQAAAAQMADLQRELQGYAKGYEERALRAMAEKLTQATHLDWSDIGREDLENVLKLDLMTLTDSQSEKDRLAGRYREYLQKVRALEPVKSYQYTLNGNVIRNVDQQDQQRYNTELKAIARDYQDAILYNEALVRNSDEWLQSLIQIVQQADNAERSMRRVNSTVQQAQNLQGSSAPAATPAATPKAEPKYMSALEYDRMMMQERLKITGRYSEEYIDLQQRLRETEYQMQVERLTSTIQNEEQLAAALRLAEEVKNNDLYQIAMEGYVARLRLMEEYAGQAESIEESTESITKSMGGLKDTFAGIDDGARSIESLGRAITQVSDSKWAQGFGGLLTGVGSAVQAYAKLASAAQMAATAQAAAETPTVWGKIAVIGTMLGEFTALVAQLRNVNSFAEGDIVPGRDWNDSITARVSSGEMIINEADQKKLFDTIHSGRLGTGGALTAVNGEELVIVINNWGRRTGRGELVFVGG